MVKQLKLILIKSEEITLYFKIELLTNFILREMRIVTKAKFELEMFLQIKENPLKTLCSILKYLGIFPIFISILPMCI